MMRVGEASHPGPHGSRKTERLRREKTDANNTDTATMSAGLMGTVQPILEDVLRQLLQELMGKMFEGDGFNLAPVLGPSDKPKKPKKPAKSKKLKLKQVRRSANASVQSPLTPAKAPVATTKPNGNDKGKGKGKGVQMTPAVPAPVAGPGTKASGNNGWTTIARRKPWCLRSEDWDAPVVEYDQMAKSLTEAKGVFKAVVLCTPDQRDTLQELLKGTEKQD